MEILTKSGYRDFCAAFLAGALIVAHSPVAHGSISKRFNKIKNVDFVQNVEHVRVNGKRLATLQSIWANDRLLHVSDLRVGDTVYNANGEPVEVQSVEADECGIWWRFVIDGDHSFVAEDFCLHNASRFWVGGGSATTWVATANTNWAATSGGANNQSVPGVGDLPIFDSNSGVGTSNLSANITVQGLDCTGGTGNYAGTLTHNTAVTLTINTGAASSVRLSPTMTYTPASVSSIIALTHTTGTANITCNGQKLFALNINGAGGTTKPLDTLLVNFGANAVLTLTAGTLDGNTFAVTAARVDFSPNNTRALLLGGGLWTIGNPTTAQTIWNAANTGTLTFTKGASNIEIAGSTASQRTFTGGALAYNDITIDANVLGGSVLIAGANTIAHLPIAAPNTVLFPSAATTTISNAPTWTGTPSAPILIKSSAEGSPATISVPSGTLSMAWCGIKDMTGTGGATFVATNSFDYGNNTGFTISPPAEAPTAAAIATAVWTDLLASADFSTVASIGKLLKDDIDAAISTRTKPADTQAAVTLVATTTNLTNAPTNGDLTAAMKASVTTAATAATPTAAAVTGSVGSVVGLTPGNLDVAVSTRMATYTQPAGFLAATFPATVASPTNITAGVITTVTNLTNAPTAGDFTATMKTSLNAATPASITGAVASVTGNVGGNVVGSVGSVTGLTAAFLDVAVSSRLASVSYTAPDNAGISFIATLTNATLDATISSRTKPADTQAAVTSVVNPVTVGALNSAALADFFTINSGQVFGGAVAGSVVGETIAGTTAGGTAPTVPQIVAGVWGALQVTYTTPGTFGYYLNARISSVVPSPPPIVPTPAVSGDGPLIN